MGFNGGKVRQGKATAFYGSIAAATASHLSLLEPRAREPSRNVWFSRALSVAVNSRARYVRKKGAWINGRSCARCVFLDLIFSNFFCSFFVPPAILSNAVRALKHPCTVTLLVRLHPDFACRFDNIWRLSTVVPITCMDRLKSTSRVLGIRAVGWVSLVSVE